MAENTGFVHLFFLKGVVDKSSYRKLVRRSLFPCNCAMRGNRHNFKSIRLWSRLASDVLKRRFVLEADLGNLYLV